MIKVNNLNKYYNKNKSNEIHVINGTTLEFPDKGLVALLGKSGSGKTTLLNVLGGLDSFDHGSVEIDGIVINKYSPDMWDYIRSKKIGYIFQNYFLINDKSVYDNLEISLKLAGMTDREEIDKRIDYALSLVGLLKYKKRVPASLSGGQQQRVGIARALVKGPSIIIADEPTGNLDSDNTFQIMDLLKGISQSCLVILVTHEEDIANFFADRIIRLKDGRVIEDYANESSTNLSVTDNKKIFLKDLPFDEKIKADNLDIHFNGDRKSNISINIIEKDGRLYINAFDTSMPVSLINDDSEIRVLDAHYEEKKKGEHKSVDVDQDMLSEIKATGDKRSAISIAESAGKAWKAYKARPKKGKRAIQTIMALMTVIICFVGSFALGFIFFDDTYYYDNHNVVQLYQGFYDYGYGESGDTIDYDTIVNDYLGHNGFDKLIARGSLSISLPSDFLSSSEGMMSSYYSFSNGKVNVYVMPISMLGANYSVILGEKPQDGEIVMDVSVFTKNKLQFGAFGVGYYEYLLGENIKVGDNNYKISGLTDRGEATAWLDDTALNSEIEAQFDDYSDLLIYSENTKALKAWAETMGFYYDNQYESTINMFNEVKTQLLVTLSIVIAISVLIMFGISSHNVKGSFINNIKEIGTYRCIGVKKSELLKQFIFENLFSIGVIVLVSIAISAISLSLLKQMFYMMEGVVLNTSFLFFFTITAVIFLINIGLTVYNVLKMLRLTPAEIMAKYDI
jgi:ABC-type lipoprotein export system ATPase subunit